MNESVINEDVMALAKFHFDHLYFQSPKRIGPLLLYQIGDLSCSEGYVLKSHQQICYEISFIVEGKGVFSRNGVNYDVQAGDMMLHRPNEWHDGRADLDDPFRYYYMGFQLETEDEEVIGQLDPFASMMEQLDDVEHPIITKQHHIAPLFIGLFAELLKPRQFTTLMMETYIRQIILMTYRAFFDQSAVVYHPPSLPKQQVQIAYEMMHYIDSQLTEITSLQQITTTLNYNYTYLSHVFSQVTGQTLQSYYNRKRFERACEWLREGKLSVTEIAERLHYQSIHSFSKAFRKQGELSPTAYQQLTQHLN
ncbi:helix-turn-helix domain-containing protein [Paenibacillus yanchengensis]|uniref:Helix-turn-helix domain-containing protein n=1 Tax=Paenibacillus yanchengensis TaxID=2035833 RepID=A0ABW4YHN5_9BACL